jgi:peptidoglycan biosynthesis protein MviN/MurJ (putative lipid II flippase)
LAEAGLAISTAIAAAVQVVLLTWAFSKKHAALPWTQFGRGLTKICAATLVMIPCAAGALWLCSPGESRWHDLLGVTAAVTAGLLSFLLTAHLLGSQELRMLIGKQE